MKSTPDSAETPARSPAQQALYERAAAAAHRTILANDLWSESQAECQACGLTWPARHMTAAHNLICPRCASRDTLRFHPEQTTD